MRKNIFVLAFLLFAFPAYAVDFTVNYDKYLKPMEHKNLISRSGENVFENLDVACGPCNRKKSSKTVEEYIGIRKEF